MRHRTATTNYSSWLKLVKKTNPKTGRKHYSVIVNGYQYIGVIGGLDRAGMNQLYVAWADHFDPARNRGSKGSLSWKFSNKTDAEQLITLALLRWGDRYVA